jgi:3-hydroxyisobutyrate dehydrogenase-like beta-hydroxyacid dehydrogenase
MQSLGFIGLGLMGGNICANLVKHGNHLTVFDVDSAKMKRFEGQAVLVKSTLEVFEKSDVIFLSLPNSEIIEKITAEYLQAGVKGKTVIDLSTSYPLSTRKLYTAFKNAGGNFIDAPLLAGPDEAAAGQLIAMISGDKAVVESHHDLFMEYCAKYDYVGESGNAHIIKIMMNFTGLMYALLLGQMFPLAEKLGIDPNNLYKVMDNEIFSNWIYRFYAPKMIDRSFGMAFALDLGLKDLTYMKKLYEEYNVPAFALDGGLDLLRTSLKDGKGKLDFSRCAATMYEYLDL